MKFDTSKIEGFDALSAEDKVKALLDADIPDEVDLSKYVSKDTFDKKASEAAEASRKMKEAQAELTKHLTEEEQKALTAKQEAEAQAEKYKAMERENAIFKSQAGFVAAGYTADLAKEMAEAVYDGDAEKQAECAKKFAEEVTKKAKAEALGGSKKQDDNGGDSHMTVADIMKIKDSAERQQKIAENIELFQ